MKTSIIFATLLLLGLSSCIPSIYPLYSPDTVVAHPAVAGTWKTDENDPWKFTLQKDGSYQLVMTSDGQEAVFSVHLVKLDGLYYMDFFPVTVGKKEGGMFGNDYFGDFGKNTFYFIHFVPAHIFAKVELGDRSLQIKLYDPDFIADLFKQRKIRIHHETTTDGQILLTAHTDELQKFIIKYGNDPKAFEDENTLLLTK